MGNLNDMLGTDDRNNKRAMGWHGYGNVFMIMARLWVDCVE